MNRIRRLISLLTQGALAVCLCIGLASAQTDPGEKLPMYGQPGIARPENLKKQDEAFVRDAVLKYGGRQSASRALAAEGWELFRRGMPDAAMRRFNQSWLLNSKNHEAYWGFGAVLNERGKLVPAIEQLETARELIDDPKQRIRLLVDLGAVHTEYAARLPKDKELERAHHFVVANQRFTESLELDPNYALGWREWAISLYAQERYGEAWNKAKRARELNAEPFPENFLDNLRDKVPEAK